MPDPREIEKIIADPARIGKYATDNQESWRSLLEGSNATNADGEERRAFFYRPQSGVGVKPSFDPSSLLQKAGDVLGDFQLERLIGQGSMGQVWEARQLSLDRSVALKLIRPDRITPDMLRFFQREGRAGGRLQHPGIVAVHGMGQTDGVHWIAQELVEGECNFQHFLGSIDNLDELPSDYDRRVALFFLQITDALQFAHSAQVIHRDLKPQNILVGEDGKPKVTDFGLARIVDEESVSLPGQIKGTPRYMSPEQALGLTDRIGPASDVFNLGAMLYGALTLRSAFEGSSLPSVLAAVTQSEPVRPSKIRPSIDRDLEAICLHALEKRIVDRYASMAEFGEDLTAFLEGRDPVARPLGHIGRAGKWVRRNRRWTIAATLIFVLMVSLVAAFGAWSAANERASTEKWKGMLAQAQRLIESGDPMQAEQVLGEADLVRPGTPESYLLRASGAARYYRFRAASRHLAVAKELGYDPELADPEDSLQQYYRGLHYLSTGSALNRFRAAKALEKSLVLDPSRKVAWYPLYQARVGLGDPSEAIEALTHYKQDLKNGDPLSKLVTCLILEQEFRFDEARMELLELEKEVDSEKSPLLASSVLRALGRVQSLCGNFTEAVASLERTVELVPEDSASWCTLSQAKLVLGQRPGPQRKALLESARDAAIRAKDLLVEPMPALELLATIEFWLSEGQSSEDLDQLLEDSPANKTGLFIAAIPYLERGDALWEDGDRAGALEQYELAVADHADLFTPNYKLGTELFWMTDPENEECAENYRRAYEFLEEAHRVYRESEEHNPLQPNPLFMESPPDLAVLQDLHVMRFILASKRNDAEGGKKAKLELEQLLEDDPFVEIGHVLNYTEALVHEVPESLKDKKRAAELFDVLEQYKEEVQGGQWPAPWISTIQNIELGLSR